MTSIYIASASETLNTLPLLAVGTALASPTYWVDKLVVALLLLGFGLWTKVTLERSKSKLALKNEMAKQRIPIIASM